MANLPQLSGRTLILVLLFIILAGFTVAPPTDNDLWWHLRSGQWMVENAEVLRVDPFSQTFQGQPRVSYDWLGQIILFLIWQVGGVNALAVFTTVMIVAMLVLVYLTRPGPFYPAVLVTLIIALLTSPTWTTRPQLFSMLFGAIVMWLIYRHKYGADVRWLWILPPLFLLWANLHGGWSLIAGAMVLTAAGEILNWITRSRALHVMTRQRWIRYVVISAVAAALMFINPFGIQTLLVPVVVLNSPSSIDLIREWQPPDLLDGNGVILLGALILLLVLLSLQIVQRRADWTQILTSAALAYMALKYERSLPFFALVAAPVYLNELSYWSDRQQWGRFFKRPRSVLRRVGLRYGPSIIGGILIGVTVYGIWRLSPDFARQWSAQHLPVYAVETMLEESAQPQLFNHYDWGGYLLWYAPDYPILIDGRSDLYTDFVFEWLEVAKGNGWEEAFARWNINTVLMKPDDGIVAILKARDDWQVIHEDARAVLLIRAS